MRRRLLVALVLLTPGCSLLGLDDFPVFRCAADVQCDPLNERDGIAPDACELHQCDEASGACLLRARDDDDDGHVAARCGGDDCDDANPDAYGDAVVPRPLAQDVPEPVWLSVARGTGGRIAFAHPVEDRARLGFASADAPGTSAPPRFATDVDFDARDGLGPIELACPEAAGAPVPLPSDPPDPPADRCQTTAECQDGDFCNGYERCDPESPSADAFGCRPAPNPNCAGADQICDASARVCVDVSRGRCDAAQLALAPATARDFFAAAIVSDGCDDGQLRIGLTSDAPLDEPAGVPGPNVLLRGDERRTRGYYGVDLELDAARRCTGASRPADAPRGVSSPAAAALAPDPEAGRRRPQALFAWLATPRCRQTGGCPADEPARVELLSAWHEQGLNDDASPWVTLANDARPVALDVRATGRRPPAIAAVGGATPGWLVSYPAEGGGVAAVFVPAPPDPPEVLEAAPHATDLPTGARTTPALAGIADALRLGDGAVDAVATGVDAAGVIGVAWSGPDGLRLATVDVSAGAPRAAEPIEIASGRTSQPALTASAEGGWLVVHREGERPVVTRVPVGGGEPSRRVLDVSAERIRAAADGPTLRLTFYAPEDRAIATAALCPP